MSDEPLKPSRDGAGVLCCPYCDNNPFCLLLDEEGALHVGCRKCRHTIELAPFLAIVLHAQQKLNRGGMLELLGMRRKE